LDYQFTFLWLLIYVYTQKKTNKQTNKNGAKIHILHQDLNPWHRDNTLSDFNNYAQFYIIMSASHAFTIFVFSIYWKGTEKLSAMHTQSHITRSCSLSLSIYMQFIHTFYFHFNIFQVADDLFSHYKYW
jgi:hypothetical protein